jgi:hypothetical protein
MELQRYVNPAPEARRDVSPAVSAGAMLAFCQQHEGEMMSVLRKMTEIELPGAPFAESTLFLVMAVEQSKPHNREARDRVKVTNVAGRYPIIKLQCGHSNQEISERKPHSSGLIRSIDLPGTQSYGRRDGMNRHRCEQFFDELLTHASSFLRISARCAMRQLQQR